MFVEQLLFDLHVYSGNGLGYMLILDAVNLLLACGEDWVPTLLELQMEVAKLQDCTYETFQHDIKKISNLAWERNRTLLAAYAHRELDKAPSAKDFIEILYTYLLRNTTGQEEFKKHAIR